MIKPANMYIMEQKGFNETNTVNYGLSFGYYDNKFSKPLIVKESNIYSTEKQIEYLDEEFELFLKINFNTDYKLRNRKSFIKGAFFIAFFLAFL